MNDEKKQAITQYVTDVILSRLSHEAGRREEALADVLRLGKLDVDENTAREAAALIPELPQALYRRWAVMFAKRLMETVPEAQLDDLCRPNPEDQSVLALVYVMFMESERMVGIVAEDLKNACDCKLTDSDPSDLLTVWLKTALAGKQPPKDA